MGEVLPGNGAASFRCSRCLCDLSCDIVILREPIHKKRGLEKTMDLKFAGLGTKPSEYLDLTLAEHKFDLLSSPLVSGIWMNQ